MPAPAFPPSPLLDFDSASDRRVLMLPISDRFSRKPISERMKVDDDVEDPNHERTGEQLELSAPKVNLT